MNFDIVMCGIPRSGSTLVWQILQAVFPKSKVLKTHPDLWEADGSTVVTSIRNPHDVAASLLRVRMSRYKIPKEITDDDIITVLRRTQMNFNNLKEILIGPHAPVLRYENFYNDYNIIFKMIKEYFNVEIPIEIQFQISCKFSVIENKKRADALKDFNEVDEYQIHGDHLGHITPGYWKYYFPEKYILCVKNECNLIAKEWNYE